MASNLEFVQYVCGQLSGAGNITYRRMFGEYGIYCDGKYFGCICDNQFFVKITKVGKEVLPDGELAPPYEGAKDCFLIEELENPKFLSELVRKTCAQLPEKKKKTK